MKHKLPFFALLIAAALAPIFSPHPTRADDEPVPREVEAAVDQGLEWLAKTQSRTGQWEGNGGMAGSAVAASTGLATMAFMARGHVPGQGPYGDIISRGVDAVIALQATDGLFSKASQSMYEQAICTVTLCEAYGMLDDPRQAKARTAIAKGVRVILDAQKIRKGADAQGGWRYTPTSSDSDLSVTGWQLMALRGASNAGANIPERALQDGIAYVKLRATMGGGFAYEGKGGVDAAMTGAGVLALTLLGQADAPEVKAGGTYLMTNTADITGRANFYYYTVYYCSQAAWQLGGNYWTKINRDISANLRHRQRKDGSWSGGESSDAYCTAMAILALTVPYRYLPIYQR
jgi:hypothetical protein